MRLPFQTSLRTLIGIVLLAALTFGATPAASAPPAPASAGGPAAPSSLEAAASAASAVPAALPASRRATVPEDRYAMAGGCYSLRSVTTGGYVKRGGQALTASAEGPGAAEPFHFQATALGSYLLYGTREDFIAATNGEVGKAAGKVTNTAPAAAVDGLTMGNSDKAANQLSTGPAGTASGRGAAVRLAGGPSRLADWKVKQARDGTFLFVLPSVDKALVAGENGNLALVAPDEAGKAGAFTLARTRKCAAWPEVQVNVKGPVTGGETPFSEVTGYYDGHLHAMAYEFIGGRIRCGRPWHRYGVTRALRGCQEHELAGGRLALGEVALSGRDPVAGHDTNAGWPTFTDWPKPSSLTYEQVYYKWLQRAWRGGLRMYTNLLVDNNQLCKIYPYKRNSCNEMDGVRLQHKRIHQLQDYIDAQSGGPGEGWFRIVDDPFEARRIMNSGRLAVVLGIEVSVLFDCGVYMGQAQCTADQIDERLDEVYAMGVRQMELVNKFDNALSGVTGDNLELGLLVNGANFLETGRFWQLRTCEDPETEAHDRHQYNAHDHSGSPEELTGRDALVGVILQEVGATGAAPAYGPGPHCSTLGLSPLGEHLIRRMIDKGMIFDPDHMSAIARDQALDIIEEERYSGVMSSHSWSDDTIYPRIWKMGGVVTPHGGSAASFVEKWRKQRAFADDRFLFGLGYGSDMNGFSNQGQPRGPGNENPLTYPFKGLGGVTIDKQVSGEKSFDFNVDGVAHYGMYPDFIEDIRILGGAQGDQIVADMRKGPEAFLQMWERASGVAGGSCRPDVADLPADVIADVQRGMTPEQVLIALGQPAQRAGDTYTYCSEGGTTTVSFAGNGLVSGVQTRRAATASTAAGAKSAPVTTATTQQGDAPVAAGKRPATAAHDHRTHSHETLATTPASSMGGQARPVALLLFLALGAGLLLRRRRAP